MDKILDGILKCFFEKNATLIEINPLVLTTEGDLKICDTKIRVDDNAHYLQKELFDEEDLT